MPRQKQIKDLLIYKKGIEIYELASKIVDLIPPGNAILFETKREILTNALLLSVKVAGAETAGLYDVKMESAAIIRMAANNLMTQYYTLEINGFEEIEYYEMVRELLEEYRLLFIEWVNSFDASNFIIDRWGLFNPPGVGPFDIDTNHNLSFNPDDILPDS